MSEDILQLIAGCWCWVYSPNETPASWGWLHALFANFEERLKYNYICKIYKTWVNSSLCVFPTSPRCNILKTKCNDASCGQKPRDLNLRRLKDQKRTVIQHTKLSSTTNKFSLIWSIKVNESVTTKSAT